MDANTLTETTPNNETLLVFVNGRKVTVKNPDPEMTLLNFLRTTLHLTGTKSGCGEGGCGACTAMLSSFDGQNIKHYAVTTCLTPVCNVHGMAVTTVEGIGDVTSKMHPVQRAIAESHGSQCGFCSPGIVMSVYALLRNNPAPTKQQLYHALDGNLCRCTGYRPILEGLEKFTRTNCNGCGQGGNCCQSKLSKDTDIGAQADGKNSDDSSNAAPISCCVTNSTTYYDPSQEILFPPELKLLWGHLHAQSLRFRSSRVLWCRPTSMEELLSLKKEFPDSRLVAGFSETGIDVKCRHQYFPVLISIQMVEELHQVSVTEEGLVVGGSVALSDVDTELTKVINELPAWRCRVLVAFSEMLKWFASTQIRNVATLGGNICNASPVSDLVPLLMACKAHVTLATCDTQRQIPIDTDFFIGYKKTCIKPDEVLVSVKVPFTTKTEHFEAFKQAPRQEDDIAIVNGAMYVRLTDTGHVVQEIRLAFGGMADMAVMAPKTMDALTGKPWNPSLLEMACSDDMLPFELQLPIGSPGGMIAYRRTLCLSFFHRFYHGVALQLGLGDQEATTEDVSRPLVSGERSGSQFYALTKTSSEMDTIGRPVVHRAAHKQCTGEAVYLDDIPVTHGELFLGLVMSSKSHARIVSVDPSPALAMPGVEAFLDYRDVTGSNQWDPSDFVFAQDKVTHEGQVIAAVVATSPDLARRAARAVVVSLEELTPTVTIQEAIRAQAIHPTNYKVSRGDPASAFSSCPHVLEGLVHVGAQEHFYLEPHGCVVYPVDSDEIEVFTTTQSPTQMQKCLSRALGIPNNKIIVHVKRLGGGFGGKETRNASILLPTALAANKTGRPVRCILDRQEDMRLTGTRHPALMTYKVGFHPNGKIVAFDADLYLNMGSSLDLSLAVLETALLTGDNAYNIPHFRLRGFLCQTNLTSCTAFRGFGGPQSILMAEVWVSHVADFLQLPYEQVRENNFYQSGDFIPCGQMIRNCNVQRCWDECITRCEFVSRQKNVDEFNKNHQWKKRGIAVTPLKYGLAFLQPSMNQGSAQVHVYTDGSVLVFHGGVEMGQGLHTKMVQVVSRELDIPVTSVHIKETSTAATANTGPTAASMSSDLYGAALVDACKILSSRLAPYRDALPHGTMGDWATAAHKDRISLSAHGHYTLDGVSLDWTRADNCPFSYFSFGAACTEVEIDCLTGDHWVLRTDIVMDVGHSLNPAIDVGQIEGAFLQGYGLYLLEDFKVSQQGVHLSTGPGTYKVPSFANIPQVFNVSLLKDSKNPRALYSSKGVGEPPLCLATSVFVAVRKAVKAARTQHGLDGHFRLDSPATVDKIRMACGDHLAKKFSHDLEEGDRHPWSVKL